MASPKLFHQGQLNLQVLNGVRACSCLLVLLVHCWTLWNPLLDSYETLRKLGGSLSLPWLGAQGAWGADTFIVLGALLATYHLLPALEQGGSKGAAAKQAAGWRSVVLNYWRRRAQRILPAYLFANLLAVVVFWPGRQLPPLARAVQQFAHPNCPAGVLRNLLFLPTRRATHEACGDHLWTTIVLVHFYLALPLLLCTLRPRRPGFRARFAAALAAAVAAGTAWRFWSARRTDFFFPPVNVLDPKEGENVDVILDAVYLTTPSRVAELAVGAALGLLLRSHAATSWVMRRSALVSVAALTLQAMNVAATSFGNLHPPVGTPHLPKPAANLIATFAFYGSPLHALTIAATILALLLRADPLHAAAARLLSAPLLARLASLSYGIYLLQEAVKFGLVAAAPDLLPRLVARAPVPALAAMFAAMLACSCAAAWLMQRLVERPFQR